MSNPGPVQFSPVWSVSGREVRSAHWYEVRAGTAGRSVFFVVILQHSACQLNDQLIATVRFALLWLQI